MTTDSLSLSFSIDFNDLYTHSGLQKLDEKFLGFLKSHDSDLYESLLKARQSFSTSTLPPKEESNLILELGPWVEDFIAELFRINSSVMDLQKKHNDLAPLFTVKRTFVQRTAVKKYPVSIAQEFKGEELREQLLPYINPFTEIRFAQQVAHWIENEADHQDILDVAARYAAWATFTEEGKQFHKGGILFHIPQKLDFDHLLSLEKKSDGCWHIHDKHRRLREGFNLTDSGLSREQALDQTSYCIWCHHQGKDSCSKGLKPKGSDVSEKFQRNSFGILLTGCPLEEKISEMNETKSKGHPIAALAVITIDNPMVAGTGHRICNDCMKACIYQKQEPVNIPGIETQILSDVLHLPWGFEIYSLLTRWNPLNIRRPFPRSLTDKKVLVVGMGPSGYTLSHHLMNDGHTVVGIDGLKIEPLPHSLAGVATDGSRKEFFPIYDIQSIFEPLGTRVNWGFGGVAEYGITVRWEKNYLKIIRLLLERRQQFSLIGGVRFGGTLTTDQAFAMGFDHIALCMGAGSPTLISMKNKLARGVRQASDFLMALQLSGAAKEDSLANLQIRLPIIVIGGGLTAIDTATEAMAYYPLQVEKFCHRYEYLVSKLGKEIVEESWTEEERQIAGEFLSHAYALRAEKDQAKQEQRLPEISTLLQKWGGVTIAYRKDITAAPSYTLNHEEVEKALEEGIRIFDHATPVEVRVDQYGHACGLVLKKQGEQVMLPARSILVAAGTKPNTNLRHDDPDNVFLDGAVFQALSEEGLTPVIPERLAKPDQAHVLMSVRQDGKAMSFFGDLHPSFAGNVVKAMASAKQGYPVVSRALEKVSSSSLKGQDLLREVNHQLRATIHAVNRLTPTILEIVIQAPLATKAFKPGQFYRLQNFESLSPVVQGTRLAMEGLALTGASVDPEKGLLSTIVLEMGGSSSLCQFLKPGDPVILMGPTGEPTEIHPNETVLLVGGGLGNAVLFSIGQAFRRLGSKVLYVAGYKKQEDRYKIEEIEAASDQIIWCCDEAPGFIPSRPQDHSFVGNIVDAMRAYGEGKLDNSISLKTVDRMIVIGSDRMMAAVAFARHNQLKEFLNPHHIAIGSINSPMQCMMKEICAQCLQRHVDPKTGEEIIVYSCTNQDQSLDAVDFNNLSERLRQNSVQEKITKLWLKELKVA